MRKRLWRFVRPRKLLMAAMCALVAIGAIGTLSIPTAMYLQLDMERVALQLAAGMMREVQHQSARIRTSSSARTAAGGTAAMSLPCAPGNFATRSYRDAHGGSINYFLYVPCNYDPTRSYPLVLLLHGGGEIGSSASSLAQNRALLLSQPYVQVWRARTIQDRWPSFIVVPQLIDANRWVDISVSHGNYQLAPQPTSSLLLATEIVESLQGEYRGIDPLRLYITGISSGGNGVWDAIERWPQMFAAALPLSGTGDPSKAAALADLPIWALRGASDAYVSTADARAMIRAIRQAGGHPRYTEYPNAGHDIWLQAYTSPDVLSWLFAQHAPTFLL